MAAMEDVLKDPAMLESIQTVVKVTSGDRVVASFFLSGFHGTGYLARYLDPAGILWISDHILISGLSLPQ